jgi:hypothetical protein
MTTGLHVRPSREGALWCTSPRQSCYERPIKRPKAPVGSDRPEVKEAEGPAAGDDQGGPGLGFSRAAMHGAGKASRARPPGWVRGRLRGDFFWPESMPSRCAEVPPLRLRAGGPMLRRACRGTCQSTKPRTPQLRSGARKLNYLSESFMRFDQSALFPLFPRSLRSARHTPSISEVHRPSLSGLYQTPRSADSHPKEALL